MTQLACLAVFGLLRSTEVSAAASRGTDSLVSGTQPMGMQNFVGDWLDAGGRTVLVGSDADYTHGTSTSCPIFVQAITGARIVTAPGAEGTDRAALIAACAAQGVQTQIGTTPIPFTTYYREKYGLRPEHFPVTRDREPRALTLPLFPGITAEQQQKVVDTVLAAL